MQTRKHANGAVAQVSGAAFLGRWSAVISQPGAVRVWGTAEGRGWVSTEPLDLAGGEHRAGLVLRLAPLVRSDSIVGYVFAPDGTPVEHARIDAAFQTPEYATSIAETTDARGRFELVVQANVPHEMRVEDSRNRWSPVVAAPVRAGQADLELRFEEPREFEIHVKSREGGPVTEFQASANQAWPPPSSMPRKLACSRKGPSPAATNSGASASPAKQARPSASTTNRRAPGHSARTAAGSSRRCSARSRPGCWNAYCGGFSLTR